MAKINRVLISLSDKTGAVEFAKGLSEFGVQFLSTGGTATILRNAGLKVMDLVKTLHPKVHGGLLGLRGKPEHVETMKKFGIETIDMVVVNLYPFKQTIEKQDCTFEDAIENIDIGGPTMLRSASKNFQSVTVVIDPADYGKVLEEMRENGGEVSYKTNMELAYKVFKTTSEYDKMISDYLEKRI
jgi:phosphoribosylaminoimidazolecarboxamide formyltransferase/IMP cyclohydrolase